MKKILPFLFLCILLIIVIIPLFTPTILGTADGFAHKFRAASFAQSLKEGILRPRWMADEAMGYGSPIFLFNYLLPYYAIGILILLGISIKTAAQIYLAITVIFSGFAMYLLVRSLWGTRAGIVAAITYAAAPYHLLSVYVYEGWGEATAFIFPPLILYLTLSFTMLQFHNVIKYKTPLEHWNIGKLLHFVTLISAWFLFILSHNPSVLMFTPILLGITLISVRGKIRAVIPPVSAFILGVFLSAFFWMPALTLNNLIKVHGVITYEASIRNQFFKPITSQILVAFDTLRKGSASFYDFTVGIPILICGLVILVHLSYFFYFKLIKKKLKIKYSMWFIQFAVIFLASLYLANIYSKWIWEIFKPLKFIIYPFRFLFPATFTGSLLLGCIGRNRTLVAVIIIVFSIVVAKPYTNPWVDILPFPDEYFRQPHPTFFAPTTIKIMGTVEFLPASANTKHLQDVDNKYLFTKKLPEKFSFSNDAKIISQSVAGQTQTVKYEASKMQLLTVATHAFPNWQAKLDGKNYIIHPDLAGRITAVVPAGRHVLILRFGKAPVESIADTLSLFTLAGLGIFVILQMKRFHRT